MRIKKIEKYFIYYKTDSNFYNNFYFIQCVKICKYPERTKEYKRLKNMLNCGLVDLIGFCTQTHIDENENKFIGLNN